MPEAAKVVRGERHPLPKEEQKAIQSLNPFRADPDFAAELAAAQEAGKPTALNLYHKSKTVPPEEAIRMLWLAWSLAPDHPALLSQLSHVYLNMKLHREALVILMASIRVEPDNPINYSKAARCLLDLNAPKEALPIALRAHKFAPNDSKATHTVGKSYKELEDFAQARIWLEKAVAQDLANTHAWTDLAVTYRNLHMLEEALIAVNKSLSLRPDQFYALRLKLALCSTLHRWREAHETMKLYEARNPQGDAATILIRIKPFILYNLRMYSDAYKAAELALRKKPDDIRTVTLAGACLIHMRKYEAALTYLNQPSLSRSEHGLWLKAKALALLGKREESMSTLIALCQVASYPKVAYAAALFALAPEGHPKHDAVKALIGDPVLYAQAMDLARTFDWSTTDTQADIDFSKSVANDFNDLTHDRPVNRSALREVQPRNIRKQ